MWDLSQYTFGDLAFNNFSQGLSEKGAQASKTVLKIFCRSFSIDLIIKGPEKIVIELTIEESIKSLL